MFRLFLAVFVLLCFAAAPAHAGVVGSAISAVAGFLGGFGSTLLGLAISVGASFLSRAFTDPQQQAETSVQSGIATDLQLGGGVYRQCVFGRTAMEGQPTYSNTYGKDNKYLQLVFALAEGTCEGLRRVWVDGEEQGVTLTGTRNGMNTYTVQNYGNELKLTFYDGSQTTADPLLVANANPLGRWTNDHIGRGVCYVIADLTYNPETFAGGIPSMLFEIDGLKLYDWRKDSSVGGTGAHRWDDPTTWEFSRNPAVQEYNYRRGIYINSQLVCGQGIPDYDLLTDLYTASANVAEELVALPDLSFEVRYLCDMVANSGAEHFSALELFADACAGRAVERAGQFGLIAGAAQLSIATVSDDDTLVDYPIKYSGYLPRESLFNELWGQFTDPDNVWSPQSYPPIIGDAATKELDGDETLPGKKDWYQVTNGFQAQRLAAIHYRRRRCQGRLTLPMGMQALVWELGDWITYQSPRRGTSDYEIIGLQFDANRMMFIVSCAQIATDVFASSPSDVTELPAAPTPPAAAPRLSTVNSFAIQATSVSGNGQVFPAIKAVWTAVTDPTVVAVILELRVKDAATATRFRDDSPEDGEFLITGGLLAGIDYEVRASIVTDPPRLTTWTSWVALSTTNQLIVPVAGTAQSVVENAVSGSGLHEDVAGTLTRLEQLTEGIGDTIANAALQEIVRADAVDARGRQFQAWMYNEQIVRVSEDEALAQQITALSAQVDTDLATAVQLLETSINTVDGKVTANATALTTLTTTVGTNTSSISTLATAVDGIEARYAVTGTINGVTGGFYLTGVETLDGSAQFSMVFDVDVFAVGDGTDEGTPFFVSDGNVFIKAAFIPTLTADKIDVTDLAALSASLGTVTAGKLQSADGQFVIDLDNKILSITTT